MKNIIVFLCFSLIFLSTGCKKKNDNVNDSVKEYNLSGKAQKGPFSPGANITISELDENLNPLKHYYLGDAEEIAKKTQAVANQGKAK